MAEKRIGKEASMIRIIELKSFAPNVKQLCCPKWHKDIYPDSLEPSWLMEFQINIYTISENDDLLTIKCICIIKFIAVEIVPSVPCTTSVRAGPHCWQELDWTGLQWGLDSARDALCHGSVHNLSAQNF